MSRVRLVAFLGCSLVIAACGSAGDSTKGGSGASGSGGAIASGGTGGHGGASGAGGAGSAAGGAGTTSGNGGASSGNGGASNGNGGGSIGNGGASSGDGGASSGNGGAGGGGACNDGDVMPCYSGDPATKDVGACKSGTETCSGGVWSACSGEVLPGVETCNGVDDDCDGQVDEDFGQDTCGVGACQVTVDVCQNGSPVSCVPLPPAAETCNGLDDDCDGIVDNGCSCVDGQTQPCYSGPDGTDGVGACKDGMQTCANGAWGACMGDVVPAAESCNGADDDCDGQIDEDLAPLTCGIGACKNTVPACQNGVPQQCQPNLPSAETCNGLDDDCNGLVDDGLPILKCGVGQCANTAPSCVNGQPNQCVPKPWSFETCNGLDDDCDGTADDGNPGGSVSCDTGKQGVCAAGTTACSNGQIVCNQNVPGGFEGCNGLDDNCNGQIDENNPGGGAVCSTGKLGACAAGTTSCTNGQLLCAQNVAAGAEKCNGVDDDCNGVVDDGNPGGGIACSTGKLGVCGAGTTACANGQLVCNQNVQAGAETCNGLDDDCDGVADDGNPGGNQACDTGNQGACAAGTTSCVGGALVCNQNKQPSAEVCDGIDNNCDGQADEGNPGGGAACNTGLPGICATGTLTCTGGTLLCVQTTFPQKEICANGKDDDCNGVVDDNVDKDGDGWGTCSGDCCDSPGACSQTPNLVNPGAYEVLNNQVDDDCDPNTSDTTPVADCSPPPLQTPTTATALVKAIDICQFTTQSPPLPQKKWGVISSVLTSADGVAAAPKDIQVGVLNNYGTKVFPKKGSTMAALSSGTARDQGDAGWVQPNGGWSGGSSGNPPPVYLAAHGGVLQTKAGCPTGSGANDSANLKVKIRVPTNAKSFSYNLKFYSAEYPEWVCTSYNDFFLSLLTSQVAGIPADHNISFDAQSNPISVNNGFFQVCQGCSSGTTELQGTGMGGDNGDLTDGGGTKWLTTTSPIKPGEDMTLEFVIFDTSDHYWDSLILLDNFQWALNPASVGTVISQ